MKKDIHPNYHEITIVRTDGSEFKTRSTWGKPGERMVLLVDSLSHPAYTGQRRQVTTASRAASFNERYGRKAQG